jgi:hypothetical protein
MTRRDLNPQGHVFGHIPYDFRKPTLARILARLYAPGRALFVPKTWGIGWTINFAHPAAMKLFGATLLVVLLVIWLAR